MAVAVAASLPWSTSLSGILIVIWLLCLIPTLDLRSLRWAVAVPAAAIPLALFAYGVIGMAWGGASFEDQWGSIKPTLRFLAFPLLFIQFRQSERGMWVLGGFLVSCTVSACRLLAADGMAFLCAARQRLSGRSNQGLHHPER